MVKSISLLVTGCLILLAPLFSCSDSQEAQTRDIVLTVNGFTLSKAEFNEKCRVDVEYKDAFKTSAKARKELLESIIRKELLLQEAQRMGLHKDPDFAAAIERYWEATLIKLLMEHRNREILRSAVVSEEEIRAEYQAYKAENSSLPPLATVERQIADQILERKKTAAFEKWVKALRDNADIRIDDHFFPADRAKEEDHAG